MPAGDQAAARAGARGRGLSRILELRGEKGLFGRGAVFQIGAAGRDLRHGDRRARPRGPRDHGGLRGLLSGHRVYAQLAGRAQAAGLPHALGGRFPRLPAKAGCGKAGHRVRGHERRAQGDRPEKPQDQPPQRRLYGRGAREDDHAARGRLYRYLPAFLPRSGGRILLVELPLQGAGEERRLAHRLFSGVRPLCQPRQASAHPERCVRLGPLSGDDRN